MPKLTKLVDIQPPDPAGLFTGVDAIFIHQDLSTIEFYRIFIQRTDDGGYLQIGDAPKSVFIENTPDVVCWLWFQR